MACLCHFNRSSTSLFDFNGVLAYLDDDPGGTVVIGKGPLATASLVVGTNVHVGLICLAGSKHGAGTGKRVGVLAHWAHNVTLLVPKEAKRHEKKRDGG